jgi:hypothetical protein
MPVRLGALRRPPLRNPARALADTPPSDSWWLATLPGRGFFSQV